MSGTAPATARPPYAVPAAVGGPDWLSRLLGDAPRLLPRLVRRAPRFFANGLHDPIFLVGCGRSGKTVVGELLGRHPDVALYPGEANHLWHPRLYPWHASAARAAVPPIWVDPEAFAHGSAARRGAADVLLLKACFGAFQRLRRRPRFVNESALIAFLVPLILREFPDARIVHVVRDGRATAAAWARRQHAQIGQYPAPYAAAGLDLPFDEVLDRCAVSWNAQVLEVAGQAAQQPAGRPFLELHYEQLCRAPADAIEHLALQLDLDPVPLRRTGFDHIRDHNAGDVAGLDTAALRRIEALMTHGLARYGYV